MYCNIWRKLHIVRMFTIDQNIVFTFFFSETNYLSCLLLFAKIEASLNVTFTVDSKDQKYQKLNFAVF